MYFSKQALSSSSSWINFRLLLLLVSCCIIAVESNSISNTDESTITNEITRSQGNDPKIGEENSHPNPMSDHFSQFDFSNHFCWYNLNSQEETIVSMFRIFHYLLIQTTTQNKNDDNETVGCKYFFYDLTRSVFLSSTIECDNIIGNDTFSKIVSTESLDYEPTYDEEEDINDIEMGGKHTIRIYGYDRYEHEAIIFRDYILWRIAPDNHTHHDDEYESEIEDSQPSQHQQQQQQSEQTEFRQEAWSIPNIEFLPITDKQFLTRSGITMLTTLKLKSKRMALITVNDHEDPYLLLANQSHFQEYFRYIGYVRSEWIIPNKNISSQNFQSKQRQWVSAYHFYYYNQYNIPSNISEQLVNSGPNSGGHNGTNHPNNNNNRTIVYETIQLIDGPIHLLDNLDLIFTIPSQYFEEQFEACHDCFLVQLDPYEDQTNGSALTDVKQHLKCDRQVLLRSVFDRSLQTDVEIIRQGFWHSFFTIFLVLIMCFVVVCLCCIILTCLQTEMQGVLHNTNMEQPNNGSKQLPQQQPAPLPLPLQQQSSDIKYIVNA